MIPRRTFLASTVAAGFAGAQAQRPNFLFLFTDDQRFDTIRALGNNQVHTPNMDRLMKQGVAFTHACTMGGTVPAVCMPSRAQLMSGLSLFRAHESVIQAKTPPAALRLFPEVLRQNGYRTFATGKWHNGPLLFNRAFDAGESIFFGGMHDHLTTPVFDYDPSGAYPKTAAKSSGRFSSAVFADATIRFLKERKSSQPFLAYTAFTSPHDPRMAPPEFTRLYAPDRMELPANFMAAHPFDNGELKIRDEMLAAFPRTPREVREHLAAYYAMVSEVDANIGRVLDALEQSGAAPNTCIIFAADNGLAVGRHGLLGKQNLYDHSLRVPLVIAGPGIPQGKRNPGLCHLMDIGPTILDLAGLSAPSGIDGRSLKPVWNGANGREAVVSAYRHFQRAIRTDRWKLILYNVGGRKTTQLFDLRADPDEMRNRADAEPKMVASLTSQLQRMLTEAGDRTVLADNAWPAF